MKILKAEVINCPIANTQWGKKRVLNCKLLPSKEKVACWSNDLNNPVYLSKKPGQVVELIQDAKGKYSVLSREEETDFQPVKGETISMNRPATSGEARTASSNSNGHYTYNSQETSNDLEGDLDLPQPLSNQDKVRLSKLIRERAKLLTHTIEVMRDELNDKGLEFHEGSIRSLSVSLFIHISRHLD